MAFRVVMLPQGGQAGLLGTPPVHRFARRPAARNGLSEILDAAMRAGVCSLFDIMARLLV